MYRYYIHVPSEIHTVLPKDRQAMIMVGRICHPSVCSVVSDVYATLVLLPLHYAMTDVSVEVFWGEQVNGTTPSAAS